jgi:hypothetical protein
METLKKYAPWIIGGIVLLFILSRLKTNLVPQTSLTQTPQPDPYAEDRATAFQSLIGLAGIQTQADAAREQLANETTLAQRAQEIQYALGLKSLDVESSRVNAAYQSAINAANLQFLNREQDRDLQQKAIDRANDSRTTGNILGSINAALTSIFGNRSSGNVFGTPKTFPIGGFF